MNNRCIRTIASIGLTATLLGLLVARADLPALFGALRGVEPGDLAIAFGLILACNVIQAGRWQAILMAWGRYLPLSGLVRMVMIGGFFSMILPSAAGGDVVRWTMLSRRDFGRGSAGQSVAADRLIGLVGLGVIVLMALPWAWSILPGGWIRVSLFLVAPVTMLALVSVLSCGWLPLRWRERFGLVPARRPRWAVLALGLAVANHIVVVVTVIVLGRAVGDATGFGVYAIFVPVVWLVSMLPLSIGGLGVREAGFVTLFVSAGMPEVTAMAIAGLWLVVVLINAACGGLLMLATPARLKSAAALMLGR